MGVGVAVGVFVGVTVSPLVGVSVGVKVSVGVGVLAFAPGEYFVRLGKPADWIRSSAGKIKVPVFVTSARREREAWSGIFEAVGSAVKVSYLPDSEGNHGSRALWGRFQDSPGYWRAVEAFLPKIFAD